MFFLPKHNIVRGAQWVSLISVFLCFSVSACAFTMCARKCGAITAPLNLPSLVRKRLGTSSWSSFKVRLEFLKDTLSVNFTYSFRQRISLLTFPLLLHPSINYKNPGHLLLRTTRSLEREEVQKKRIATHFWMNGKRRQCNRGQPEVECS